jgi:hypothetical protein
MVLFSSDDANQVLGFLVLLLAVPLALALRLTTR